jgi:phage baseplate assembly protein W
MANETSPLIQSDASVSKSISKSKIVARRKGYRDLDLALKIHPIRKDLNILKDDNAIKNAVRNLLISNAFERPFQPQLGANLRGLLFEPADAITKIAIKENVSNVIKDYEPRVKLLSVAIKDLSDQNAYRLTVKFLIKEYDTNESVEILLRRLR